MNLDCPNCGAHFLLDATFPVDGRRVRCTRCTNVWRAMPNPPQTMLLHPSDLEHSSQRRHTDVSQPTINEAPGGGDAIVARDFGDAEAASGLAGLPHRRRGLLEALDDITEPGRQDDAGALLPAQSHKVATPQARSAHTSEPSRSVRTIQPALGVPADFEDLSDLRPRRRVLGMLLVVLAVAAGFVLQVYILTPASMIRTIPASADLYRALGVVVSRHGLTIGRLSIQATHVGPGQLLAVAADIENAGNQTVRVPRVVVSAIDARGRHLSSTDARVKPTMLAPGQRARLLAELPLPTPAPYRVQARFSNSQEKR